MLDFLSFDYSFKFPSFEEWHAINIIGFFLFACFLVRFFLIEKKQYSLRDWTILTDVSSESQTDCTQSNLGKCVPSLPSCYDRTIWKAYILLCVLLEILSRHHKSAFDSYLQLLVSYRTWNVKCKNYDLAFEKVWNKEHFSSILLPACFKYRHSIHYS